MGLASKKKKEIRTHAAVARSQSVWAEAARSSTEGPLTLFPSLRRTKTPLSISDFDTTHEQYDSMDAYYAIFRRDSRVRDSIVLLADFSTNKGSETELALIDDFELTEEERIKQLEEFAFVKTFVDRVNARVNLDERVNTAIKKSKIYGWAGFEIVPDTKGIPARLVSLKVNRANESGGTGLHPIVDTDTWAIKSFSYKGKATAFKPEEILWFTNLNLDEDFAGLSDIEPIQHVSEALRYIETEALKESTKRLWAPTGILLVDTGNATEAAAGTMLENILTEIKPGKWTALSKSNNPQMASVLEVKVLELAPQIQNMVIGAEYLESVIVGNFSVPRFLLGIEKQFNRATAFAQGQLFLNGPITEIQRYVRRVLESQWYPLLVKLAFEREGKPYGKETPVTIKHRFNPVTMEDWTEVVDRMSNLFDKGILPKRTALERMGFDVETVLKQEREEREQAPLAPPTFEPSDLFDVEESGGKKFRILKHRKWPR